MSEEEAAAEAPPAEEAAPEEAAPAEEVRCRKKNALFFSFWHAGAHSSFVVLPFWG